MEQQQEIKLLLDEIKVLEASFYKAIEQLKTLRDKIEKLNKPIDSFDKH
jgi:septal ring factor EnvC (AmiA/AmiB activator)